MARKLGLPGRALPPEVDLGPRLVAAIREAMEAADGDLAVAGPIVQERMAARASDVVLTSLFGVDVLATAAPPRPWAVVEVVPREEAEAAAHVQTLL